MKTRAAGAGVLLLLLVLALFPLGSASAASKGEIQMKKGLELYSAKKYAAAADSFKQASALLEKEKKLLQAADASYNEGLCRRSAPPDEREKPDDRYKSLMAAFDRAAVLYGKAKEGMKEVNALLQGAQIAFSSGRLSEAEKRYEESRKKGEKLKAPLLQGLALEGLGKTAFQRGMVGKSTTFLSEAHARLKEVPSARLRVALQLAAAIRKSGDLPGTLLRLEEADKEAAGLAQDEKNKNLAGLLRFLMLAEQGHTYLQLGVFHKAQEYLRTALEFEQANPLISEENRMNVEGNNLVSEGELGNPRFSADALETLRRRAGGRGLTEMECTSLISMGRMLMIDGKYPEAMRSFEDAAGVAQRAGLGNRYIHAVIAKGNLMYFQGMWKASENAYRLAFHGALEQGDMESVLVSLLGVERIARANHLGLSGKMDYRRMQGVPWRGALLQEKNILPVRGGSALRGAWTGLMDLSRGWFLGSEPGIRGALAVEAAADLLSWSRMKILGGHLVAEGILRLVTGREEVLAQVTEALLALEKGHAVDPDARAAAYAACWDVLAHGAGKGLLVKAEDVPVIQYDGFRMLPEGPSEEPKGKGSVSSSETRRMLTEITDAFGRLSLRETDQKKLVRALINGEPLPDFLLSLLAASAGSRAVERAHAMEGRLAAGGEKASAARKEFAGIILEILDRLGSSPLDEIRGNDKLGRYLKGIERVSQQERMNLAEKLAGSTPPFIIYSLREAAAMADVKEAWNSVSLRIVLLRNLGVLGNAKEMSLRQGVDYILSALTRGTEIFERRFTLSENDSPAERERKITQMVSLAKELARAELSVRLRGCRSIAEAPEGLIGFDDRQAARELLARYLLALGETRQAALLAEKVRQSFGYSARITDGVPNPEVVWRTLSVSAKAALASGDIPEALRFLDQAIDVIDSVSPSDGTSSQATADKLEVHRTAIETAFSVWKASPSDENAALLWRYLEGMKSRQWREMLASTGALFLDGLPEKEKDRYYELRMKGAQLSAKISFMDLRGVTEEADEARAELQNVRRSMGELTSRYTVDFPRQAPDLDEVADSIAPDWGVANYYISRNLSFVFVLGKGRKPEVVQLPLDYDSFFVYTHWMRTLPDAVEFQPVRANDAVMAAGMTSPRLAEQLFEPVARFLGGKKKLLVIPHDLLYTFPYETMSVKSHDGERRFLLDEGWTFAEIPSAFLFSRGESGNNPNEKKRLVVMADPEYYPLLRKKFGAAEAQKMLLHGIDNPLVRQIRDAFCRFMAPLQNARKEGEYLVEKWKGFGEVQQLMGRDASEKRLYDPTMKVSEADYLHIVCHGYDRNSIPDLQPGLALSPVDDKENDSFAQMGELAAMRWRSELVVLSACDTGLGDLFVGDGMIGLNTVFLAGGAKGMLISRWRVPDESAPEFMRMLYGDIVSGAAPVDALSSAKRSLKKTYEEASHWAVFKYVGVPW